MQRAQAQPEIEWQAHADAEDQCDRHTDQREPVAAQEGFSDDQDDGCSRGDEDCADETCRGIVNSDFLDQSLKIEPVLGEPNDIAPYREDQRQQRQSEKGEPGKVHIVRMRWAFGRSIVSLDPKLKLPV